MYSFDNLSSSLGCISSVSNWPVSRGRHRKLIDNFSHESDVMSLQDPFTSRPYKTPFNFYYCVPRKIPRGILFQLHVEYSPSSRLLVSALAVYATVLRTMFPSFLQTSKQSPQYRCVSASQRAFWIYWRKKIYWLGVLTPPLLPGSIINGSVGLPLKLMGCCLEVNYLFLSQIGPKLS